LSREKGERGERKQTNKRGEEEIESISIEIRTIENKKTRDKKKKKKFRETDEERLGFPKISFFSSRDGKSCELNFLFQE
jgi:hypothetical protein